MNNFRPPPPRPPPPSAAKANFPSPPSGAQKWARFTRPETAAPWTSTRAEDAKAKTNDFKAWGHMRHGEGPTPTKQAHAVPPKDARPPMFPTGREPTSREPKPAMSAGRSSRRPGWEQFPDAGMPSISRANTTRAPLRKNGFAPSSPGGDEPQARSAYFNISRADHPSSSRPQTHMAPPPGFAPTAKKLDPLQQFKTYAGVNDPLGNSPRLRTPYHGVSGEKTDTTSPKLYRSATSATPRESNSRSGRHDSEPISVNGAHNRAASTNSAHHTANLPKTSANLPGLYSSSSASSSDQDEPFNAANPREKQIPKSRRNPVPIGRQNTKFRPNVRVEEAEDEPMAPPETGYAEYRRHSSVGLETQHTNDERPAGFMEHRAKHEAEKSQQQSTSPTTSSGSINRDSTHPPVPRSDEWYKQYGHPPTDKECHVSLGDHKHRTPMYDTQYSPFSSSSASSGPPSGTPSSGKWSDQWPFKSPKKPSALPAEPPPYWAIPSSLPPPSGSQMKQTSNLRFFPIVHTPTAFSTFADSDPFDSFRYSNDDLRKSSANDHPVRSRSSESVNIDFSPNWEGPLRADRTPFASPPIQIHQDAIRPNEGSTDRQRQQTAPQAFTNIDSGLGTKTGPFGAAAPADRGSDFEEKWKNNEELRSIFSHQHDGRSPSRTTTRKRPRAPRTPSMTFTKRPATSDPSNRQPTVSDAGEETTTSSAAGENMSSSKASSDGSADGSAMDIDPVLTPPSANDIKPQMKAEAESSKQADGFSTTPRQAPTLPPRPNGNLQHDSGTARLGLNDLKNAPPFGLRTEGLQGINSLRDTLPFESRASPTGPDRDAQDFPNLPRPPMGPEPPMIVTSSSWDSYAKRMSAYMMEWSKFNHKMIDYFQYRQHDIDAMGPDCMLTVGEAAYANYTKTMEDQAYAREYWDVAFKAHTKTTMLLGPVRKKALGTVSGAK